LKAIKAGDVINGVLLVKSYSVQLTKNGKEYIIGNLMSGVEVPFKAWDNSSAFPKFKNEEYTGVPSLVQGVVEAYNGQLSIMVNDVNAVEGFTPDQFLPIKYNANAYWDALTKLVKSKVSDKAYNLLDKIFFSKEDIVERFKYEFAAQSHHDNCKSGLLAHTYKVVGALSYVLNTYQGLVMKDSKTLDTDKVDLFYVGALFHDIGKIDEMKFGIYQSKARVTHRFLGIEYFAEYKNEIIESYNEDWYYNLVSIILQHHGEYEDKCRTIYAQVIHLVDVLDSSITDMLQLMESPQTQDGVSRIKLNGNYLML